MEKWSENISPSNVKFFEQQNKEIPEVVKTLENFNEDIDPIGEGGNAKIYSLQNDLEKYCFKKSKKKPQIKYNDIDTEHNFQKKARNAGVKTPLSSVSFETAKGEYLLMERVFGCTIREAILNPRLLSKKFKATVFIADLRDQVEKMHNARIYHRDLHFDNVMINEEGLPVIIDFGTAIESDGGEFTYEESVSMYNERKGHYEFVTGFFKDDNEMVKNIWSAIKNLEPINS